MVENHPETDHAIQSQVSAVKVFIAMEDDPNAEAEVERLNIGGSWYVISDWYLWKIHWKFKKRNETESVWNLDFNNDGDKLDVVAVWRNFGSFTALDNNGF